MMPGEKQAEPGGVASEASAGTCENCTVLNRSLDEYMTALLTLKQKIIDTDHLLSEFKEKCDELQKSQRESSTLHKQLDEVLLKLGPLEKQTMDFEAVKLELEKTKIALKSYQQKSEEVDSLREENAKTHALNEKLEVDLKTAEDTAKTQSLEYAKLRSEKKTLEETLQKTQDSLRMCQQAAEEAEDLRLQNAKTLILKSNLENQLLVLEDTKLRQMNEITDLRREKSRLEENHWKMQENLKKLEKEVNKEKRTTSTQTKLEPSVNKAKVRMLLEELWHCVEPLSQTTEMLDLNGAADSWHMSTPSQVRLPPQLMPVSPCRKQISKSSVWTPAKGIKLQGPGFSGSMLKVSPGRNKAESSFQEENSPSKEQRKKETGEKRKRTLGSEELELRRSTWIDEAIDDDDDPPDRGCRRNSTDLKEVLECFMPLPPALSPIPYFDELVSSASVTKDEKERSQKPIGPVGTTFEQAEMKGPSISNVNTSSLSDDKDNEQPAPESTDPAEPSPTEDAVVTPSINSSPGPVLKSGLLNTEVSLVLNSCLSESQDMEVEEGCEVKERTEDLTCAAATQGVESAHGRDCVTVNPARITTQSQLNTVEDHISIQCQSAGSEIPNPLSVEAISKKSDPDHTGHKCLDTDVSAECSKAKAEVTEDTSEIPLNTETHSGTESENTVKEIQTSITSGATTEERRSKTTENQNIENLEGQEHNSSSTKTNGVSCVESSKHEELSDEEEFFNLKRKVKGIFLKPGQKSYSEDLNSFTVNMPQSVGKQEFEDQFQKTNSGTEEGCHGEFSKTLPSPENEKDGARLQESITDHACKPTMLKDSAVIDGQQETAQTQDANSLQIIDTHDQQKKEELSEALDLIVEKTVFTELKECNTKAEDSSVNPQDVCAPALVVPNPVILSDMDKGRNLSPLTAFASRDALASTPSPEFIGRVRTEMGPPLPPAVMPLAQTPPKFGQHHTPVTPKVQLPVWLPTDEPFSPKEQPAVSSLEGLQDEAKRSPCLTTPSPSCGVPSSPLQFGSATPKHAVPVPGRLPSSALNSSSPSASQENSMQMLDSMYPELSAQARTLNILRGNVNLARAGSENGASPPSVNQISGNKTINSSSTAFTKTEQKAKRTGVNMLLPKSAKKLRLDACSPVPVNTTCSTAVNNDQPTNVTESTEPHLSGSNQAQRTESKPETKRNDKEFQISDALEKLQKACFDVLPVIKSHVFLGRISEVPVLRDEEKSVISDFCSSQCSAEEFMSAVLTQMKTKRAVLKQEFLQSICRVYTGLCRQRGDRQIAHAFAYSILKENFPEAPKLILFMVTTWPSVLSCENSLCKAIQTVCKLKAEGEILDYLTAYLHWDKTPPGDIHKMISSTLKALLEGGALNFQKHDRHGDDLSPIAWEYIFTLDLLCAHLGWKWTHDNIIGKELWPVMNAWVSQPRLQQTPVRDVCVAAVLRLIGKLGQLGIKEKLCKSVENVAKAINLFGKHGIQEGVPWEVQLSAIYTIYDLAAINPKDALEAMASWRGETTQPVPSSVTSCITQIGCLCRQIRP